MSTTPILCVPILPISPVHVGLGLCACICVCARVCGCHCSCILGKYMAQLSCFLLCACSSHACVHISVSNYSASQGKLPRIAHQKENIDIKCPNCATQ